VKIGVLALQGAFREQAEAFGALDAEVALVKAPEHLAGVDAIVLPGGESTTVDKLLDSSGLRTPLRDALRDGMPALASAWLIVLAAEVVDGRFDQQPLGVIDVTVRRNGYGRQRDSSRPTSRSGKGLRRSFSGVFIQAPVSAGAHVEVLRRRMRQWWGARRPVVRYASSDSGDVRCTVLSQSELMPVTRNGIRSSTRRARPTRSAESSSRSSSARSRSPPVRAGAIPRRMPRCAA
jgi:5'-phosphate synthase pdxT subunit